MRPAQEKNGSNNGGKTVMKSPAKELLQKWTRQISPMKLCWGICFILAILSLAGVAVNSHRSGKQLQAATQAVTHTREVIEKLENIAARLSEVGSAARSFAISGKQSHLSSFYTAAKDVPPQIDGLKLLLKDDTNQLQSFTDIEPVINRHLKVMTDMVGLGDKNLFRGFSQRSLTDEGNTLMDQIKTALSELEDEQHALLEQEQTTETADVNRVTMVSLAGSGLAIGFTLAGGACALYAAKGRRKAEEKTGPVAGFDAGCPGHRQSEENYWQQREYGKIIWLQRPGTARGKHGPVGAGTFSKKPKAVLCRLIFRSAMAGFRKMTTELCGLHKDGREFPIEVSTKPLATEKGLAVTSMIRDITERKQAAQQISDLNKELELRALELENANKELEAFSYSVSHDLRSPLQNIETFSLILMEDYANQLDAEGLDYVQRLRDKCRDMEDIIEALLALSKMMRMELLMDHFDLSSLASAVAADLKQKNPDRLVDWIIADGLTAKGAPQSLRVVVDNVFWNAWKFTSHRPRARIEFGALPQANGSRTYFVRDDGAGFDMTRAGNLFTPFKRLHDQSEFRGTGIGLATVQRVIHRHQGKNWAEGAINQGATFCFTLADEAAISNGENHHPIEPT